MILLLELYSAQKCSNPVIRWRHTDAAILWLLMCPFAVYSQPCTDLTRVRGLYHQMTREITICFSPSFQGSEKEKDKRHRQWTNNTNHNLCLEFIVGVSLFITFVICPTLFLPDEFWLLNFVKLTFLLCVTFIWSLTLNIGLNTWLQLLDWENSDHMLRA